MTRRLALCAVALALLAGCSGAGAEPAGPGGRALPSKAPVRAGSQAPDGAAAARAFHSVRTYPATAVPTFVRVPRIHVASSLDRLGRASDGTVEPPAPGRWQVAGWYELGPRPGEPGSAVILGHVDSKTGPAVFFRLRELRRGDEILVSRADGSTVRFVVERIGEYPKKWFPTDQVYYPTLTPELRLVTCGGQFDFSTGHYKSNVIVFATVAA
ncbi:MAG TPA: class F sortase [Actinomycetes bacterium]